MEEEINWNELIEAYEDGRLFFERCGPVATPVNLDWFLDRAKEGKFTIKPKTIKLRKWTCIIRDQVSWVEVGSVREEKFTDSDWTPTNEYIEGPVVREGVES